MVLKPVEHDYSSFYETVCLAQAVSLVDWLQLARSSSSRKPLLLLHHANQLQLHAMDSRLAKLLLMFLIRRGAGLPDHQQQKEQTLLNTFKVL